MGLLQVANLILVDMELINPLLAPLLQMKYVHGYNINIDIQGAEVPIPVSAMDYKSLFLNNCNIVIGLPLIILLSSLLVYLVGKFKSNNPKLIEKSKHILK